MKGNRAHYSLYTLMTTSLLFMTSVANATPSHEVSLSTYLGADPQIRNISYPQNFGGNVYKKYHPQVNAFGGLILNEHFGFEAGYELTPVKTNTVAISKGQSLFGNLIGNSGPLANSPLILASKFQAKDWNMSILGFLTLSEDCHLQLIGGTGFAKTKLFQSTHPVSNNVTARIPFSYTKTFIAKRGLLRFTGGIQHVVSDSYGIRILTNWINTSKFKKITGKESPTDQVVVKNSWSYGAGLFVKF